MLPRRRLLQAAALAGGATVLPSFPAQATASDEPEGTLTDLGPASVTTPWATASSSARCSTRAPVDCRPTWSAHTT